MKDFVGRKFSLAQESKGPFVRPSRFRARHQLSNPRGATIVEFSVVALVFFTLISVIFDVGVTLWRYSLLTHTTVAVAREVSVNLFTDNGLSVDGQNAVSTKGGVPCTRKDIIQNSQFPNRASLYNECIAEYAQEYSQKRFGMGGLFSFSPSSLNLSSTPYKITIKGVVETQCLVCLAFPGKFRLAASAVSFSESSPEL